MGFCLPKDMTEKFLGALRDGTIDPAKMIKMSSADRRAFLSDIVGESDAKEVNTLFESKLLLKDQQAGLIRWAKKVGDLTPTKRAGLLDKINGMEEALTPETEDKFLNDLVNKKLGTEVTYDEAKHVTDLAKGTQTAKEAIPDDSPIGSNERLDYGAKMVAMKNYLAELKLNDEKPTLTDLKTKPISTVWDQATKIGGFAKSMKAIGDISSLFRQGGKTMYTHPTVWGKRAGQVFSDMAQQLASSGDKNEVMNAIQAEIYSRPNAINGNYDRMKIDIGTPEELLPSSLPEKIPLFGRLFKATQVGYNGMLYKVRADIADKYLDIADKSGVNLNDQTEMRSIGKMVNALTGRGYLGAGESAGRSLNTVFFSPKMIKANLDVLTAHTFQQKVSPFVRRQAAINLVKIVAGQAAILSIAKTVQPNSVDLDPRSANFGKIKIGPIAFDISTGENTLLTLAARLIENSTKSTTTGKITPLNTGKFGAQTSGDVIWNFITNKAAPVASVALDIANRSDYYGNKPTVSGEAQNALTPFPVENVLQAQPRVGTTNAILGEIFDALGLYETLPNPPRKK